MLHAIGVHIVSGVIASQTCEPTLHTQPCGERLPICPELNNCVTDSRNTATRRHRATSKGTRSRTMIGFLPSLSANNDHATTHRLAYMVHCPRQPHRHNACCLTAVSTCCIRERARVPRQNRRNCLFWYKMRRRCKTRARQHVHDRVPARARNRRTLADPPTHSPCSVAVAIPVDCTNKSVVIEKALPIRL